MIWFNPLMRLMCFVPNDLITNLKLFGSGFVYVGCKSFLCWRFDFFRFAFVLRAVFFFLIIAQKYQNLKKKWYRRIRQEVVVW